MSVRFAHLHLHSEYSLVDSTIRIKGMVEACVRLGIPAVALTDDSNMFGLVKFYKACSAAGIKPIGGCDVWVSAPDDPRPWRLTLICQDREGYLNLSRLVSRAWRDGQQSGRALVDAGWLTPDATRGLIALLGRESEAGRIAVNQGVDNAAARLRPFATQMADRLYLELTRTGRDGEENWNVAALALASQLDLPVIASNDVRFLKADNFESHEARVCINQGRVLADPKRPRDYSDQQFLKSPEEMEALFADLPEALENTIELAKRCTLELEFGTYYLPDFPVPEGHDLASYIRAISRDGLRERLEFAGVAPGRTREEYEARLERELDVIIKMGFPGYFLIVADFINWGKQNGIPVGPGRGSGAGSLVAWVLKITDLDPIQFDLLFERFLNPERVSMPDFDIDFCMDRRDEVIDYVARKYGRDHVSQIITYGSMAAKAVLRDSGRVLGMGYNAVDRIAKLIPARPLDLTLQCVLGRSEKAKKEPDRIVKEFCELYEQDEEARTLIDLALSLESLTRNVGKHAGGVVIGPRPLTEFAPLYCEPGGAGVVTQYDKDDVEAVGLVKFDFLGLRTLTIIDWAVKAINVRRADTGEEPLDISALPLDDAYTYNEVFKKAQTVAIFQFESAGMQRMLKDAKADRFEDLIALGALYRPGPMDLIPSFVARKHGREEVIYPDPRVEPVLKETYGIMVYQEQVMQMAQIVGGYTLGGADLLRRAMGKKKVEEMAKERAKFREGAAKDGVSRQQGRRDLRRDGEVRRLRLQQVARRRVRLGVVSDRVVEGALPRRVHGRDDFVGHGQHRQGRHLHRRVQGDRPEGVAAGRQCVRVHVRGGGTEGDPLRPGRDQRCRPGRVRSDCRRTQAQRPVQGSARFLPSRGFDQAQSTRAGSLDSLRFAGCAGRQSRQPDGAIAERDESRRAASARSPERPERHVRRDDGQRGPGRAGRLCPPCPNGRWSSCCRASATRSVIIFPAIPPIRGRTNSRSFPLARWARSPTVTSRPSRARTTTATTIVSAAARIRRGRWPAWSRPSASAAIATRSCDWKMAPASSK